MPGSVPRTGDSDNYKSNRNTAPKNKSEYNKMAFPNFVSENSAGRCFSKEMFHSQLILETLGKHKEFFFPEF